MSVIYVALPVALLLAAGALLAFAWSLKDGQLDDLDTPPYRALFDDIPNPPPVEDKPAGVTHGS